MANIHPLSATSLHIQTFFEDQVLGDATGFCVKKEEKVYLVTNQHVLSGKHVDTGKLLSLNGSTPNKIKIWHHVKGRLGEWIYKEENLYDENSRPRWKEHPSNNKVDVVALLITTHADIEIYPLDLSLTQTDLIIFPSEPVSVIGFPKGIAATGKIPIWKTAHLASDLDLNPNGQPTFIIDTTTKQGMSGSPVVARRSGFAMTSRGMHFGLGQERILFMGIYSGRLDDDIDLQNNDRFNLGIVWKADVLNQILN